MPWNFNPYAQYGQQYQPQAAQPQQPFQKYAPTQQLVGNFVFEVFGRQGAEALQVGPNSKVVAFDERENVMYRIQTDAAGVKDIVEFDFRPREQKPQQMPDYVTREQFEALAAKVDALAHPAASKSTRTVSRKAASDE